MISSGRVCVFVAGSWCLDSVGYVFGGPVAAAVAAAVEAHVERLVPGPIVSLLLSVSRGPMTYVSGRSCFAFPSVKRTAFIDWATLDVDIDCPSSLDG